MLSPEELENWHRLATIFPTLSESADSVIRPHHTASGCFTVKSLYSRLIEGSATTKFRDVWRPRVPLKIKIFMWQAICDRLPAADQLRKRNGPDSDLCVLCDALEDS